MGRRGARVHDPRAAHLVVVGKAERGGGRAGLILLDLMMPRMSGSEFRMIQKVDPNLRHLPVVLLSADGAMEEKAKALETDGAIRKPIDLEQLLKVIEHFRDAA